MTTARSICVPCRIKLASVFLPWWKRSPLLDGQSVRTLATVFPSRSRSRQPLRQIHNGIVRASNASSNASQSESTSSDHEAARLREVEKQRELDPELAARAARRYFGDRLPDGVLSSEEHKIYERLYGPPLSAEQPLEQASEADEDSAQVWLREGEHGDLETVEFPDDADQASIEYEELEDQGYTDADVRPPSQADAQLQEDIAMSLQRFKDQAMEVSIQSPQDANLAERTDMPEENLDEEDDADTDKVRHHPFTVASRFGTSPSTIPLPHAAMTGPISLLLSSLPNKHLDETAHRLFGGPGLPYSPATPLNSRTMPQKPIPLPASQLKMAEMEADVYMAAIMPGTYASILSVLTELRRRLGTQWIERLMQKEEGPRILDAGAAGAGVLAWREILKAEWLRIHESNSQDGQLLDSSHTAAVSDRPPPPKIPPIPLGKATVLTGSPALRQRASLLLENTTFLPRLPDYAHTHFPSEDTQRKQYDVIIAPHSLWHMQENWERREKILNLWSLLNPAGGVLVFLEKGVPRGFEIIAETRSYMLKTLFERATAMEDLDSSTAEGIASDSSTKENGLHDASTKGAKLTRRAPARIVAPCPGHAKCPMYVDPDAVKQRKDYCHFSQRFIRPEYYQRMLGAKQRNYEDVEFSYIAVQKGVADGPNTTAKDTTDRAFKGYGLDDADLIPWTHSAAAAGSPSPTAPVTPDLPHQIPHHIPRIVLPPLKRKGHVHLDLCLPTGALERWTVPRSLGRQAYKDARKARWGDLWALGAKQRENRRLRLGIVDMQGDKGKRGAAQRETAAPRGSLEDPVAPRKKAAGKLRGKSRAEARRRDKKRLKEQFEKGPASRS